MSFLLSSKYNKLLVVFVFPRFNKLLLTGSVPSSDKLSNIGVRASIIPSILENDSLIFLNNSCTDGANSSHVILSSYGFIVIPPYKSIIEMSPLNRLLYPAHIKVYKVSSIIF